MKISQLKEQIRGIIRERSVKAIQKDYSNVVSDMEKHLELYKKSKGTPEEKKHIGHLKDLTAKKKKLQSELDLAVAALYKNAELKVDEAITNPKKTNPSDLAKTVLGWFDFYTDYIDDGGQRRRAIKNNEDTLVWFGSHPKDVKEKAYKIMLSQSKDKGQIERNFGKHLKESVIKEDTRRVKLLGIDFKVSEMNGRIFFSFVDKKAATIQLRKVGTNKIVNHIQNRLDIAYGKGEFFFKSGDHAEFQNGYLFQRNTSNINLNKIKFESVNEGLYHVGYNKGRGQGTGVFKDSYSSYKDAKKAVEKLEKERGGSYNQIAYYVADKDGKFVRESVKEVITNPKKTNPSDLAKIVLGWFDFYTDYIDDGGQRRSAIKNNEDTLVWFGSHPKDVKEKAYKIMLSQAKSEKGQIEKTFGKHLKESELKGYLAADVVDDIVKSIGSKFISGQIKNAPNRNYIYLKLTDIKFGSGVVKMLKSQFGINAKIDKTFANIPSVSFASNKVINEAKAPYEVYHKSYTSAIEAAREYAEKKGFEIDNDDAFRKIGVGPRKPSEGKTNSFSIQLSKDGKPQRKQLHIQVYGMKNSYELNAYIG
jgi:hypothetical protein